MNKLITSLFLIFFATYNISAQIFIHRPYLYYEYPYIEDGDGCHYFKTEMDSSLLNFNKEFEGYIDLKIFGISDNMKHFALDDDGFYFCSYEKESNAKEGYVNASLRIKKKLPPAKSYDTIYVLRNEPIEVNNSMLIRGESSVKSYSYTSIPLITSFSKEAQSSLLEVQVEFKEGDIIMKGGKMKIMCPYNITSDVIKQLNKKLIKVGYLSDKKRGRYETDIRDALYEFQEDNGIEVGFINQETIDKLELDLAIR